MLKTILRGSGRASGRGDAGSSRLARASLAFAGLLALTAPLATLLIPAAALAQDTSRETTQGAPRDLIRPATPFLPPEHWAHGAARRLEAAGLAPEGFGGGARSRTLGELAALFMTAELRAYEVAPELAGVAGAYRLRFAEEFHWALDPHSIGAKGSGGPQGDDDGLQGLELRLRLGYEVHRGRALAGIGYDGETDWTGARSIPDRRGSAATFTTSVALPPHLAFRITPAYRDEWALEEGQVVATLGALGAWAGRRVVGFHPGAGGGITLSRSGAFDGGGLFLDGPVRLPWWLGYLGPVRFELMLSRIENGDRIVSPWFGALHGSFQPHPRLELGFTRADIFGGKGNSPTTVWSVLQMLFGTHAGDEGEYNNEVFAAEVRYRPPLGPLPLSVYLEWGMDDSAGAWRNVPARVVGAEVAALPRLPEVALGVERTTFAGGCCGNTIWYRNWSLRGGWSDDGRPLGHPLAGHGEEWLVFGRADLFEARLSLDLHLFTRERGAENLFAPERAGRSRGGSLTVDGRLRPGLGIYLQGVREVGAAGWRETALRVGAQRVF